MSILLGILIAAAGIFIAVYWLSFILEMLRVAPDEPESLPWASDGDIQHVSVDGIRLRYLKFGVGPVLVMLHTLRTQLDLFDQCIPELANHFTVIALDFPGHGFSDIPDAEYDPDLFIQTTRGFLDALEIENAVITGTSIGATIALVLAAKGHPAVGKVIAINSYDYDRGRGIMRGSLLGRIVFTVSTIPVIGGLVWRLRWPGIFREVLKGSVHKLESLRPELLQLMHRVGNRRGHYRAFMSLIDNFPQWEEQRAYYAQIKVPVLLIYGRFDWSTDTERNFNRDVIPGAEFEIIENAGHLLSLDEPAAAADVIKRFASENST